MIRLKSRRFFFLEINNLEAFDWLPNIFSVQRTMQSVQYTVHTLHTPRPSMLFHSLQTIHYTQCEKYKSAFVATDIHTFTLWKFPSSMNAFIPCIEWFYFTSRLHCFTSWIFRFQVMVVFRKMTLRPDFARRVTLMSYDPTFSSHFHENKKSE